jgi:hypothetical protein
MSDTATTFTTLKAGEQEVRRLAAVDTEGSVELARKLAVQCRELHTQDGGSPWVAAVWLRLIRRAALDRHDTAPIAEALEARHPGDLAVQAAVAWLRLDWTREHLSARDMEPAAECISACLDLLGRQANPSYLGLGILGGMRAFTDLAAETVADDFGAGVVAIDILLDALEKTASSWIASLPLESQDAERGSTRDTRGVPGPRLRGCLLLRKLCRRAERWPLLGGLATLAEENGVRSEWLDDAAVEAKMRMGEHAAALTAVRLARRHFPGVEALARREAEILGLLGQDGVSIGVLLEAAASSRTPWPWRDLGSKVLAHGAPEANSGGLSAPIWALGAFEAGLSLMDRNEPGTVWGLHFELARLHFDLGDEGLSAEEAWLAREARILSGWGVGANLEAFLVDHHATLSPHLERLDREPPGQIRRMALKRYATSHTRMLHNLARPGRISAVRESFGFVRVEGIADDVFFAKKILPRGTWVPERGDRVRVAVVKSFDVRKQREGYRAVWLARDDGEVSAP